MDYEWISELWCNFRERSGLTEDDSSISALRISLSLSLSLFLCLLQKIKSKLHYNN